MISVIQHRTPEAEAARNFLLCFAPLSTMWWHYDSFPRAGDQLELYRIVDGLGLGCALRDDTLHLLILKEDDDGDLQAVWSIRYVEA